MNNTKDQAARFRRLDEPGDYAACVLSWLDCLVGAGIGAFDDSADEFPILHLRSGEVFVLGDSSITRMR